MPQELSTTDLYLRIGTVAVSVLALIATITNIIYSVTYSRRNILNNLHQFTLRKANDCNQLWKEGIETYKEVVNTEISFWQPISEIIVSVQLLDASLKRYSKEKDRPFLIKQFWIQLNPGLRSNIKQWNPTQFHSETFVEQMRGIQKEFSCYFDKY